MHLLQHQRVERGHPSRPHRHSATFTWDAAAAGQTPSRARPLTAPSATPNAAAPIASHISARRRCHRQPWIRLLRQSRHSLRTCHLHRLPHQKIQRGHPCPPNPPAVRSSTTVDAGGQVRKAAPARATALSVSSSAAARSRRAMRSRYRQPWIRLLRQSRHSLRTCHLHRLPHQKIQRGHPCPPNPPAVRSSTTVDAGGQVRKAAPARATALSVSSSAAARSRRAMRSRYRCLPRHRSCPLRTFLRRSHCRGRRLRHQHWWWRSRRRRGPGGSPATAPRCCCPRRRRQPNSVTRSLSWCSAMAARRRSTC